MTAIGSELMDIEKSNCLPSTQEPRYVPQQLIEANELLNSINRRLEDCALEWQADISRKQWKIFKSKALGENSMNQSVLVRTYFVEKDIDEAFHHLLSCHKIFSEYLKNFIALLQGKKPTLSVKEMCDAQNQCTTSSENYESLNGSGSEPFQLSSLANQCPNAAARSENLVNNILTIQNTFAEVIKAKVNFDTKFLGLEAVLHKTMSSPSNVACLNECCSTIVGTSNMIHRKLRNVNISQRGKTGRKREHLTRSTRTLSKKKRGIKSSISISSIGDQLSITANKSYKDPITL